MPQPPLKSQELACDCRSQNVPTAFLLLHDDGNLHIYLQLEKFKTCMGLPAIIWDDTMFAQKGELYHNSNGQLVIWRPEYFRQVNVAICVPLANTIDTALVKKTVEAQNLLLRNGGDPSNQWMKWK